MKCDGASVLDILPDPRDARIDLDADLCVAQQRRLASALTLRVELCVRLLAEVRQARRIDDGERGAEPCAKGLRVELVVEIGVEFWIVRALVCER